MSKLIKNQCVLEGSEGCFRVEKLLHNAKFEIKKKKRESEEKKLINYLLKRRNFQLEVLNVLNCICFAQCFVISY